ncbi:class I SAM-dependent methyltransferase [Mesorhizobium qingshengii]|uniref:class I SAM-dependent methyltransferase n=1 Tax=Mesorhizobium qingshengii TaxID=1165689 RepID=UPI002FD5BF9E
MQNDFWMFFRSWMAAPLRVAAIAPSGNALAKIITQDITSRTGQVIELGPGTGVFTAKLLERGVRPEDLTLVEYGATFAQHLETRFPRTRVLRMDATRVGDVEFRNDAAVGAVISGLPLLKHARPEGDSDPRRGFRPPAVRRVVLPIHLWSTMPSRPTDP